MGSKPAEVHLDTNRSGHGPLAPESSAPPRSGGPERALTPRRHFLREARRQGDVRCLV